MAAQTKSRASRAADKADQDQQQPQAEAETAPQPEPAKPAAPAKPTATFDLGARPVVYHFPHIVVNGETFTCPHTAYGHESEKSSMTCVRKLAAEHGAALAK
jgi:hypothetical protein